ncbi:hypothetical protein I302_105160 [Kwoniella bestiolae CBS 10118]|uniref:Major facilitator superfamily (MFS) profile domain-containing protein n=1 Tax=Kwoniella bestiolae CBS 10118 TaxID=1296100 RepID=A0A1B9FSC5_9TREE|nr:hypothetical protein I302_08448 [Kwoniella bestiolae CBS 10118]OCF21671.1 hypothetical protein I302_08448 [Kwoniella bestiolae CBS 10118]
MSATATDYIDDHKPNIDHLDHQPVTETPLRSAFADLPSFKAIVKFRRAFATGIAASLGGMYIGYCGSAIGNIVANPGFLEQFGTVRSATGALSLDAHYVSTWGAVQQVGQIVFQVLAPFVVDRFGRKVAMYALTFFMLLAIILEIVAKDWKVFLAAKLFAGCASGWLGPAVMTYMSEVAMPNFRGIILSSFSLALAIGQFTNAIASQIVNDTTPLKYKHVFYSEFVYLGIWGLACLAIPESPAWLISKGRIEQAKKAHKRLVGPVEGYDHEFEFQVIEHDIKVSEDITRSYSDNDWKALFKWGNFKRCLVASLPFAAQQFAGVPYIFNYTTYFFQIAGLEDPFQASTIINVIYIVAIISSFFLVERLGRRPLVLAGLSVLVIVNTLIGALGFISSTSSSKGAALTALCSIWMFSYSISLAPIGWLGIVEVSSAKLRAKTASFGVLVNSLIGLVFNYTVPLLLSDQDAGWGQKIGIFFGGLSLLFLVPIFFFYPETKGRTYAEIDELFERNIPARKFKTTQTETSNQPIHN